MNNINLPTFTKHSNNMSLFNKIKKNNTTQKTFSYSKGEVTLNFTLSVDTKDELKDFLELLKVAQEDITTEITNK